jgi:hypothetical protein
MVIYRSPDGKAAFQQVDDLASAVAFVEKIRNESGVENGRIYRLEQVNYRFEPYYQVRLDAGESSRAQATPPPPPPAPEPAPAPSAAMPSAVSGVGTASVLGSPPTTSAATVVTDPGREQTIGEDAGDGNGVRRGLFGR